MLWGIRFLIWATAGLAGLLLFALYGPVRAQEGFFEHRLRPLNVQAPRPRSYGYRAHDEQGGCQPREAHATSVLADSEEGALKSARRHWGALVRSQVGEQWMDIAVAIQVRHKCYRASTNETALGKVLEAVGDNFQWRCEIKARACQPGWSYEEKGERR